MNKKYLLKKRHTRTKSRHYIDLFLCQCSALLKRRSNSTSKITCGKCKEAKTSFDSIIPLRAVYKRYEASAWQRELSFDLEFNDFIELVLSNCVYCSAGLSNRYKHRKGTLEYNGIDRVDNKVGYQLHNSASCCRTCNTAKMEKSVEEFTAWAKRVARNGRKLK